MTDLECMGEALKLAKMAFDEGEVPVGCVITRNGEIVGRGRNRRETGKSAIAHAEIEAICQACEKLNGWRLWECTLYVTLEPCPMCAGAILNARIDRVIFGCEDEKLGACGTAADLFALPDTARPRIFRNFMEDECRALLREFFKTLR